MFTWAKETHIWTEFDSYVPVKAIIWPLGLVWLIEFYLPAFKEFFCLLQASYSFGKVLVSKSLEKSMLKIPAKSSQNLNQMFFHVTGLGYLLCTTWHWPVLQKAFEIKAGLMLACKVALGLSPLDSPLFLGSKEDNRSPETSGSKWIRFNIDVESHGIRGKANIEQSKKMLKLVIKFNIQYIQRRALQLGCQR